MMINNTLYNKLMEYLQGRGMFELSDMVMSDHNKVEALILERDELRDWKTNTEVTLREYNEYFDAKDALILESQIRIMDLTAERDALLSQVAAVREWRKKAATSRVSTMSFVLTSGLDTILAQPPATTPTEGASE